VFYKDCHTSDPVNAAGVNAATTTDEASVALANTLDSNRVVGFAQNFDDNAPDTPPTITGVTAFINDASLGVHTYDVGDTTSVAGTVTISNSATRRYTSTAAISLKASPNLVMSTHFQLKRLLALEANDEGRFNEVDVRNWW